MYTGIWNTKMSHAWPLNHVSLLSFAMKCSPSPRLQSFSFSSNLWQGSICCRYRSNFFCFRIFFPVWEFLYFLKTGRTKRSKNTKTQLKGYDFFIASVEKYLTYLPLNIIIMEIIHINHLKLLISYRFHTRANQ